MYMNGGTAPPFQKLAFGSMQVKYFSAFLLNYIRLYWFGVLFDAGMQRLYDLIVVTENKLNRSYKTKPNAGGCHGRQWRGAEKRRES
jgi:hypothetical protein